MNDVMKEASKNATEVIHLADEMRGKCHGHDEMIVLCATIELAVELLLDMDERVDPHTAESCMFNIYSTIFTDIVNLKKKERDSATRH